MQEGEKIFETGAGRLYYALYKDLKLDDLPKDYIFPNDKLRSWGTTDNLDLNSIIGNLSDMAVIRSGINDFAASFGGHILIKEPGIYVFKLVSDGSSALILNGKLLVDNVAHNMILDTTNIVALDTGYYQLRLVYLHKDNTYMLLTEWKTPNTTRFTAIPTEVFGQMYISPPRQ